MHSFQGFKGFVGFEALSKFNKKQVVMLNFEMQQHVQGNFSHKRDNHKTLIFRTSWSTSFFFFLKNSQGLLNDNGQQEDRTRTEKCFFLRK